MSELQGKVALVTGSSRGLGRAYALYLARLGADVVVHDISTHAPAEYGEGESAQGVVAEIEQMGRRSILVTADVGDDEQVQQAVQQAEATMGRIDILVNNAGGDIAAAGGKPQPNDCVFIPHGDVRALIDRNLVGTITMCRHVVPGMMQRRSGKVVNIASLAALVPVSDGAIYAVAKAGIIHYTRCLALQMRPYGINVNCIAPGPTVTARFLATRYVSSADLAGGPGLKRLGQADDLAKVVHFLVSDQSGFVSGQTITVDGGRGA